MGAARQTQPLGVWWVGVAGLALSLLLLLGQNLRAYGVALGATLGVLALLRACLPARLTGGLSVRGRWVDVATLLVLGAAVALLATNLRQV
ncbi:DUF3017 domain-containing protein [Ornithinimicrobium pratense]|uniref:DUF3017 domain-containing protein n=1 Tax=Ornithinimicrobium pratense TaxID=2593973 RepID=A0A5J6V892_9MICO|nr:DUF3017 domain-containing protein [Ornithinimicrobium pratense]